MSNGAVNSGDAHALTRNILEQLRSPEQLDDHPWAAKRFVREAVSTHPVLMNKSAGFQLAFAVGELFRKMLPGVAPKRGKRLDTQWGAFGILAANYFAPFLFGEPYPVSLRDAWGKIDEAILTFRFGKDGLLTLSEEDINRYKLVGDELEVAPLSTLSDWQRKGVELLAEAIAAREAHLDHQAEMAAASPMAELTEAEESKTPRRKKTQSKTHAWLGLALGLLLLVGLVLLGVKAYRVYQLALVTQSDLNRLKSMASLPVDSAKLKNAGGLLQDIARDIANLQNETASYLRTFGAGLRWVPQYGEDIAAAADLLDAAGQFVAATQTLYAVGFPIYQGIEKDRSSLNPQKLTALLVEAQPQLAQARRELDLALALWNKHDLQKFSPRTRSLLSQVDQPIDLLDKGLSLAIGLPGLLGASSDGLKTYLVLLQNEDELRPTGGFITAIFKVVVKDGSILSLDFEDTEKQEDWTLPYPDAPWQMRDYMGIPVMVLRDANWFTNFPTTVSWVEFLYAYNHQHSLDGVIALDQQVLVALLSVTGPINVQYSEVPVTSANVITFMRDAKTPPFQPQPTDWTRKSSIKNIGNEIIKKLTANFGALDWQKLVEMVVRMLNERHLLLQFDDKSVAALLAELEWDGGIHPGNGDFLMVVDSNIGYNKANPVVETLYTYDVDLTQPQAPESILVVSQANASPSTRSCVQYGGATPEDNRYPIYHCYWNYLRVYALTGATLTDATPHQVPADWMILQQSIPARVDTLDEKITGVQGYGTMVVVPGGQTYDTRFTFALPARVVSQQAGTKSFTYSLKLKKQPGTSVVPVVLRVHLPPSARVDAVNLKAVMDGANLLVETNLRTDINLTIKFTLP